MAEDESLSDLIPGLPDEVALLCLARLPFAHHPLLSCVCRSWRRALQLPRLFHIRARLGFEEHFLFIVMRGKVSLLSRTPAKASICAQFYLIDSRLAKCYPWAPASLRGHSYASMYHCGLLALGRQVLIWPLYDMNSWLSPERWDPLCMDVASRLCCAPSLPIEWWRRHFASATVDGYVYAAGGFYRSDQKSAERFNLTSKKWQRIPDMIEERIGASGVAWKGSFCVFGGMHFYRSQENYIPHDSAEVWDALKEEWQLIPGILPNDRCTVVTVKGKLYALKYGQVKEVMLLDEKRNHWIPLGNLTDDFQGFGFQGIRSYDLIGVGDELCVLASLANHECILLATDPESLPLCWRLLPFCFDTSPSDVCVITL